MLYTFIHCARLPPLSRILHVDIVLKARAETLTEINFISSMKLPKRCRMLSTSSLEHLKKCGKNIRDFVPLSICLHEVTRYKMWSARALRRRRFLGNVNRVEASCRPFRSLMCQKKEKIYVAYTVSCSIRQVCPIFASTNISATNSKIKQCFDCSEGESSEVLAALF